MLRIGHVHNARQVVSETMYLYMMHGHKTGQPGVTLGFSLH